MSVWCFFFNIYKYIYFILFHPLPCSYNPGPSSQWVFLNRLPLWMVCLLCHSTLGDATETGLPSSPHVSWWTKRNRRGKAQERRLTENSALSSVAAHKPWTLNLCPSAFLDGTGAHFTYTDCDLWGNAEADLKLPAESEMETWTTNFNLEQWFSWNVSIFYYIVIVFMYVSIRLM